MVAFGVSVIENREGAVRKKENGERREAAGEKKKKKQRKKEKGSALPNQKPPLMVAVMSGAGESLEWLW
jgi:hypothetical protein